MPLMLSYLQGRREYIYLCWQRSKQHWAVSLVAGVSALYSITSEMAPFIELPSMRMHLPKLPLSWAIVIVLLALSFILLEGGYRLRDDQLRRTAAERATTLKRPPRLLYAAFQFVNGVFDKDLGVWREGWGEYTSKALVFHFANLEYEDGHGTPASGVRAQIIWEYDNGSPGPAFLPAAWIDEERGIVDIPVGCSKKLIIGIKCESGVPLGNYWEGYSNPRINAGDRHRLDGQMVPSHGSLTVKLVGSTDELCYQQKWKWEEDLQTGSHPHFTQL